VWKNGGVFYGCNFEIQVVEFGGGLLSLRIFEGQPDKIVKAVTLVML
jgi:hypothetical protein